MKYIEKIFDVSTGEETTIERDMTAEEVAAYNKAVADAEAAAEAAAERAAARQAVLDRLGITEEEAKLILGGN